MAFRRNGLHAVQHSDGFEVREQLPAFVAYSEGGRTLHFSAELTGPSSPYAIILYEDTKRANWEPPHHGEVITPERLREMEIRVTAALAFLGVTPLWSAANSSGLANVERWRDIYALALARVAAQLRVAPSEGKA